jgi:hypothetical protein
MNKTLFTQRVFKIKVFRQYRCLTSIPLKKLVFRSNGNVYCLTPFF